MNRIKNFFTRVQKNGLQTLVELLLITLVILPLSCIHIVWLEIVSCLISGWLIAVVSETIVKLIDK